MSYQAYFSEVEAVIDVLNDYIKGFEDADDADWFSPDSDEFTALWQAVELLGRAYHVLMPLVAFDMNKAALLLPDIEERKSTLLGPDGNPV